MIINFIMDLYICCSLQHEVHFIYVSFSLFQIYYVCSSSHLYSFLFCCVVQFDIMIMTFSSSLCSYPQNRCVIDEI